MTARIFLSALLSMIMTVSQAQSPGAYKRSPLPPALANGITLNFPNYIQYGPFGGWSVGAEYRRLFNSRGTLGASLSVTRLIWAGTAEAGKYYASGQRANIKANMIGPGFNYYPFGSDDNAALELGVLAQIGAVRRVDSYQSRGLYTTADSVSEGMLFVPQLHLGLSVLGRRHFLLTFYGDFGPMLACDSRSSGGNYGVVGIKIGGRF